MAPSHNLQFDLEAYTRAQDLFAAKRNAFPPDAVVSLARDVISRLATGKGHAGNTPRAITQTSVLPDMVDSFCEVLLADNGELPLRFLENDLAPIVRHRSDLYGYIAAASQRLGTKWDDDEITFLQVTIAVGKLYALVRSVGYGMTAARVGVDLQKSALFASTPGEQHTLGVTIATEVFRNAGWDISLMINQSHDALLARAQFIQPPVVGLSISNNSGLDALARLAVALRLCLPDTIIAVATGPEVDTQTLRKLVDLDIVISDAQTAVFDLSEMLRMRQSGARLAAW